ncbi:MAG: Uncharacterised protein [Cellulomonadaceae bacterium TMED98]|nr:MAG: Uncharacterised protein [Cellulomonadaceae bacterium TMED98]
MHGQRIHSIDTQRGDTKSHATSGQTSLRRGLFHGGRHRVEIVFDEEHERDIPGGREVHRLQHGSDIDGSVAKVGDREVFGVGVLLGPRVTGSEGNATTNNRIGS